MSERFVVDAWAVLALLQGEEPAARRVKDLLSQAQKQQVELFMSMINLGEVFYRIGRIRGLEEAQKTLEMLQELPVTILSATNETVLAAAAIKIEQNLSYADAFAVVAASQRNAVLVTGDPELLAIGNLVCIEPLQRRAK